MSSMRATNNFSFTWEKNFVDTIHDLKNNFLPQKLEDLENIKKQDQETLKKYFDAEIRRFARKMNVQFHNLMLNVSA